MIFTLKFSHCSSFATERIRTDTLLVHSGEAATLLVCLMFNFTILYTQLNTFLYFWACVHNAKIHQPTILPATILHTFLLPRGTSHIVGSIFCHASGMSHRTQPYWFTDKNKIRRLPVTKSNNSIADIPVYSVQSSHLIPLWNRLKFPLCQGSY